MAGLAAAVRARELGAEAVVFEKGDRPGGSMLLSHGAAWRHRDWETFRAECPRGEESLQRLVYERLDDALAWLESLGAAVAERGGENPRTTGSRFDTRALTATLAARVPDLRLGEPLRARPEGVPVVLATGGFQGDRDLVRRYITREAEHLWLRANPWSAGDGLRLGLAAGARLSAGMDEFYGRNLPSPPARVTAERFRELTQLYARYAVVENERGERFETKTWSEIDVAQWTARQPGARARYVVPDDALGERVGQWTVGEMIDAARRANGPVEERDGTTVVGVTAGITTTLGGLAVDPTARAADGVFAAGMDAGGVATGGYSSGLAWALVSGRLAAESALR
jgi:succinate dehydrogenase/fumarate reductase flavoprotein subunit